MSTQTLILVLAGTIAAATPLLYAALGELFAEVGGVLNLSVEGMMLVGAIAGFLVASATGSAWAGVLAGLVAGMALAAIFTVMTVTLRTDQIVTGLALVVLGDGIAQFIGKPYVGQNLAHPIETISLPGLSAIPILGPVLFGQNMLVYISYLLVPLCWYFLYQTQGGLALRAVGEKPSTADVVGLDVFRIRYMATLFGGAMAGVAGAFLSLGYLNAWAAGISAGRGWVALALVILSGWNPIKLMAGAYLFGFAYIMAFQSQIMGGVFRYVSVYIVQMFPYVLAILVLAVTGRRSLRRRLGAPAALTIPYVREERS